MSNDAFPPEGPDSTHADSGDPNRDRADLADMPPTEVDDDAVRANTSDADDDAGTDADAARS
ncbi:hypothetical protein ACFC3F_06810 [Microbacterium sp. NPDC055910]|uniref:hypothetical protein n=1 Tax=Microbacterium sp. NPDC055910 TaxID=3345659 RepID=UPI0035D960C3